jgi:hypothetical protein
MTGWSAETGELTGTLAGTGQLSFAELLTLAAVPHGASASLFFLHRASVRGDLKNAPNVKLCVTPRYVGNCAKRVQNLSDA